jgi:putative cell wall-binding protein
LNSEAAWGARRCSRGAGARRDTGRPPGRAISVSLIAGCSHEAVCSNDRVHSRNELAQIHALGFVTVRIGGADRYSTAALIAAKLATAETIAKVYLATGINFPDALAAASAAGSSRGVILLTAGNVMPGVTSSWLAGHAGLPQLAVGAQAAVAAPSATVLAGIDRYDTATAVATATYPAPTGLLLATGVEFPDALAGAAYAAQQGWALLLVNPGATTVSTAQDSYFQHVAATVTSVVILGGTSALPDAAASVVVADMENQ